MVFRLLVRKRKLFGAPLEAAITQSPLQDGLPLPVSRGLAFIEEKAMKMEGVYRVSGSHKSVNELQKQYDRKRDPDLSTYEPFVVTGMFKKYLTTLPEPLMTFELYDSFLSATKIRNKNERIRSIRQLVKELPQQNYFVLEHIIKHLIKVSQHHEENKMGIANLAIVFGPTLFRLQSENPVRVLTDAPILSGCVQVFMREFDKVFGDEPIEDDADQDGILSSWEKMRNSRKSRRGNRDATNNRTESPPQREEYQPPSSTERDDNEKKKTSSSEIGNGSDLHAQRISRTMSKRRIQSFKNEDETALQAIANGSDDQQEDPISNNNTDNNSDSNNIVHREYDPAIVEMREKTNDEIVLLLVRQATNYAPAQHISFVSKLSSIENGQSGISSNRRSGNIIICDQSNGSTSLAERRMSMELVRNVLSEFWHNNEPASNGTVAGSMKQLHDDVEILQFSAISSKKMMMNKKKHRLKRLSLTEEHKEQLKQIATDAEILQNPADVLSRRISLRRKHLHFKNIELEQMDPLELEEEKNILKRELRNFDKIFTSEHGRAPSKIDKEPLRDIYNRYRKVRTMIGERSPVGKDGIEELNGGTHDPALNGRNGSIENDRRHRRNRSSIRLSRRLSQVLLEDSEWLGMMLEKRQLQSKLLEYQREHMMKYGQKPKRGAEHPLHTEYERYTELKSQMQDRIANAEEQLSAMMLG